MSKSNKQHLLAAAICGAILTTATNGLRAEPQLGNLLAMQQKVLRGDYGLTAMEVCVETPREEPPPAMGFDANRTLLQDAAAVPAVITGVLSFDTNGEVELHDGSISDLFIDQKTAGEIPIISESPLACDGTYKLGADRRISFELSCQVPLPGGILVTVEPLIFNGFMARHRLAANFASLKGNIQTESIDVRGTVVSQRERVCVTTGSLVRL